MGLCCFICTAFIGSLPFIVCDLYFGYEQNFCTLIPANDVGINLTLRTWLLVSGYLALSMMLLLFLLIIKVIANVESAHLLIWYYLLYELVSLFNFCWIIVGAVMFWGYLYPKNLCNDSVGVYMYARLVLGFIGIVFGIISNRRDKKKREREAAMRRN